jgi:hypothetical protein
MEIIINEMKELLEEAYLTAIDENKSLAAKIENYLNNLDNKIAEVKK